jgi:hypothetical protein
VENSTFWGGIDPTPPKFTGNLVYWADQSTNRLSLPISTGGSPTGGQSSVLSGDTFVFPNGTNKREPFALTVPDNTWSDVDVAVSGNCSDFLISAPGISLSESSEFSQITYDSLGNNSPVDLLLFDVLGSVGFVDLGAAVWALHGVFNDLPVLTPSPASDVRFAGLTPDSLRVEWDPAWGPVTNYTVLTGTSVATLAPTASVGNVTSYALGGLTPAETVYVSVEAWNASYPAGLAPAAFTTTPDWTPGVPVGLSDTGAGPTSIALAWQAPTVGNVSNYTVLLASETGSDQRNISVGTATNCTVTGLLPGVEYGFEVEAWNESWTMGPSATVYANTTAAGSPPPADSPPPSPPNSASTGSHPLSLGDWAGILEVFAVVVAGIVAPLAIVSRLRAGHAAR